MAAYGTAAAISEVLAGKKSRALSKYARSVRPFSEDGTASGAAPGDSPDMGVLRSRIKAGMDAGLLN
jgi:hypothetical protein